MLVRTVLYMALVTTFILCYIADYREEKRAKEGREMKGRVQIALDDYNELIEKAMVLDELKNLMDKRMYEETSKNYEKAEKTEYLMGTLYIEAEKICEITGWEHNEAFVNHYNIAAKKRMDIIESKLGKKIEENADQCE